MDKIDSKYSGKDKRNTQGYLKEKEKQELRKKENNVSRVLDNYYWPNLHNRAWFPNGLYIIKKKYSYADSGLGYFYEKNNVEQLKDITEKDDKTKKKYEQHYVEYNYLEPNQFTVTIEYCANCEEHSTHTRHSPELYKNYALKIQKCIMLRFPFINVLLKPIDTDILKEEEFKLPKLQNNGGSYSNMPLVNDKFKEVRIGAMEVQICVKKEGSDTIETSLIHSKLKTSTWPKISKILDKIVSFLPTFKGKICLYEKQDEEEKNENGNKEADNEDENDNPGDDSKLKDLQVNIYLLQNEKIQQIINESLNDIKTENDPHKRKEKMKETRLKEKESMYRPGTASLSRGMSSKSLRPNSYRPVSTSSHGRMLSASTQSTQNNFFSTVNINQNSQGLMINNKSTANQMKGKLILTKYTNEEGIIDIGPLPYDSYFIEVVESNQFQFVGMPLTFTSIYPPDKIVQKYIGLYIQENAFLQLHVFETVKDSEGNDDQEHVGKCQVTLKTCKAENIEEHNDEKEIKIKIEERREGIFEHVVKTGRYLLEVSKDNFETVRKFCDLERGLNSVNIEMVKEKNCPLTIHVFNFEKYVDGALEGIKNCEVTIYKNSREILCEGITNKKGEMTYIVTKNEDFLTIVINKLNYRQTQRTFIRSKSNEVNESGEHLYFLLVREDYTFKNSCMILLTYGNMIGDNFDRNFQISDKVQNNIQLIDIDKQEEYGIVCTVIKYNEPEENQENSESENGNFTGKDDEEEQNNYDDIISLAYTIKQEQLLISNYQDKGWSMNGLERYSFETLIFSPNNTFYIPAPTVSDVNYNTWVLGWLDPKQAYFYETNYLTNEPFSRIQNFDEFLEFLQIVLDKKIYVNIFKDFDFDKGILMNNDRFIYSASFKKRLEELEFSRNKPGILNLLCEMMKHSNKLISYSILKKKITSNLKNFKSDIKFSQSKTFDELSRQSQNFSQSQGQYSDIHGNYE